MSVTVTERPYKYCFSKNEIRYVFLLDNLTRINLVLEVKIRYKRTAASGDPIIDLTTLQLVPDADGYIYLGINKYIDSVLSYVLPDVNSIATKAIQQTCLFWVEFKEVSNVDIENPIDHSEDANKRIAIKGGISKEKFSRNNFFENLYNSAPFFFTWQPSGRFIYADQNLFISAFFPDGDLLNTDSYEIVFDTMTTSNVLSQSISPLNTFAGNNFYHFNTSIIFTGQGNDVLYFDVSIQDISGNIIIGKHRFYVQYRPLYNYYDLVFHNSLGGVDTVRVRGDVTWELEKNIDDGEGGFNNEEAMAVVKTGQFVQAAVNYSNKYKGDIGFLNTKQQQQALIEILISRSIYWYNDSRFIPCLNVQKSLPLQKNSDELFSFPIEWNVAINNEVYTPMETTLGIGDTTTD